MTRRQIWLRVSKMFDKPLAKRTPQEQILTGKGICYAAQSFGDANGFGSLDFYYEVSRVIGEAGISIAPFRVGAKGWSPQYDTLRAQLAALMAAMTVRDVPPAVYP